MPGLSTGHSCARFSYSSRWETFLSNGSISSGVRPVTEKLEGLERRQRGAMMKLLCIVAAAMALVVASSTAMAEPKKQSVSNKATHRMKSPRSVPAPLRQWPPNNPTFREYEELKRQGWYKEDKA
jgi:hypothetical protein